MATATEIKDEPTREREVLGVFVTYIGVKDDWRGKRLVPLTASRAEKVQLRESDERRLDELGMLVPEGSGKDAARIVAERANAALQRALNPYDVIVPVEPSVVVVSPPSGGVDPALLGGGEGTVISATAGGVVPASEGAHVGAREAVAAGDVDSVAAFLRDAKPNAQETVGLAGDDPQRAQTVIDAENAARDGDGRSTVLEPLQRVVEKG